MIYQKNLFSKMDSLPMMHRMMYFKNEPVVSSGCKNIFQSMDRCINTKMRGKKGNL